MMLFLFLTCYLSLLTKVNSASNFRVDTAPRPTPWRSEHLSTRSDTGTIPPAQYIQVPVDHFSNNTNTYSNRYWINDTYYKANGPVFLLDAGEVSVTQSLLDQYLNEATAVSSPMALVRQFNGLAIFWEHRFYGESSPVPVDNETGLAEGGFAGYQYLTIDQALEDVVYLANHFQPSGLETSWSLLSSNSTPWIFIGGSYPGTRAAWSRIRSPETWFASWSSSAPVQLQLDMQTYYGTIASEMTSNCSADLHAALEYVEGVLLNGSTEDVTFVKALLSVASNPTLLTNATAGSYTDAQISQLVANVTDEDTASLLLNFLPPNWQYTGFDATILPYCTSLEQYEAPTTNISSSATMLEKINSTLQDPGTGVISSSGVAARSGNLAAFQAVAATIYQVLMDYTAVLADFSTLEGNPMPWNWQQCYELGFAQIANTSSPINFVPPSINTTSWLDDCKTWFPYSELPPVPNTLAGLKYGGWNMRPSNVMFTNGLKDPWHTLSVQSTTTAYGAPNRTTTNIVPKCNELPAGNDVFGLAYPDGWHIGDLSKDIGAVNTTADQGVALFASALKEWLPCFNTGKSLG